MAVIIMASTPRYPRVLYPNLFPLRPHNNHSTSQRPMSVVAGSRTIALTGMSTQGHDCIRVRNPTMWRMMKLRGSFEAFETQYQRRQ